MIFANVSSSSFPRSPLEMMDGKRKRRRKMPLKEEEEERKLPHEMKKDVIDSMKQSSEKKLQSNIW